LSEDTKKFRFKRISVCDDDIIEVPRGAKYMHLRAPAKKQVTYVEYLEPVKEEDC